MIRAFALIAALLAGAVWLGSAPAAARSLSDQRDDEIAKKKRHRDGGTRDDEEKEEDFRRLPPVIAPTPGR